MVALKVIRDGAFASRAERQRFQIEIELAASLKHPNIVSVYACGDERRRAYYAMEFIEGVPLEHFMDENVLSVKDTVRMFLQICDAVAYAHMRGVIHRDLKPSNILVDGEGQLHILDFGLAKAVHDESGPISAGVTQTGDFAGTWYYASPEQARRDPLLVDVRSDVYTLGVILYELLTDALPYPIVGESRDAIAQQILTAPPIRPSALRAEVDDDLDTVTMCALRKEPDRRYQSAADLSDDLRRYLDGRAIDAKRESTWYVFRKTVSRHRGKVAIGGTVLAALVTFAITVWVLYAEAVRTQATMQLRGEVVRHGQRYLFNRLEELSVATNRIAEFEAAEPGGILLRPLNQPVFEGAREYMSSFGSLIPDGILAEIVRGVDSADSPKLAWLSRNGEEFDRLRDLLATHRFAFPIRQTSQSAFQVQNRIPDAYYPAMIVEVFIARALLAFRSGDDPRAVSELTAGRALAVNLGDAVSLTDKSFASFARDRLYDGVLLILNESQSLEQAAHYVRWLRNDPPLASYSPALIYERLRFSQFYEAAATADGRNPGGSIDVELMEQIGGNMLATIGYLDDKTQSVAASHSAQSVIDVVDQYIHAIETWERLTYDELQRQVLDRLEYLAAQPEWRLIRPYIGTYNAHYKSRGATLSKRARAMAAADIVQFRIDFGHWPLSLDEVSRTYGTVMNDPFLDVAFIWTIQENKPCFTWPDIVKQLKLGNKMRSDHGIHIDAVSPRF
jgi:hypothetical protein